MLLSDDQIAALVGYVELLVKWNRHINLISRKDVDRVVTRHILDSLSGTSLVDGIKVLDIGSGGGLPGIPLAIACPDKQFLLCDRMQRRVRFLTEVVRRLGIDNVQVSAEDVAELDESLVVDTAVARAVATVPKLWDMVNQRLSANGKLLAYSSTDNNTEADEVVELKSWSDEMGLDITSHQIPIPGLERLHTLIEVRRR